MSAIVKAGESQQIAGIVPQSFADVAKMAQALANARGFVPNALLGQPHAIAAAIMTGMEIGIGPMQALREVYVIDGRPMLSATLMLSLAIRAGVRHQWLRSDETTAHLRLTREGFEPHEHAFTAEEAKRAGLAGRGNWAKYGPAMLRARCLSAAMRAFCPDVLGGSVYVEGEIEEPAPQRPVHREPERPSTIDAQLVELEATAVPSRPAPTQLTQTATAEELQSWCDANGGKLRALPGARQGEAIGKVVAHAERIGVGAEDVWRWLELPMAEDEAAQ